MSNLRGNLQSISLTDVVQLLHVNRRSGELRVSNGRDKGILFIAEGEVVHAELGRIVGEGAAYETLEWERGEFEFVAARPRTGGSIRRVVPDLLMQAARHSDHRKRLRSLFPSLDAIPWPTLSGPELTRGLKLFEEDERVIPSFDGFRDFRQVMEALEQDEVAVLHAAHQLREAGRLKVLEPLVTLRVVPLKTGLFRKGGHVKVSTVLGDRWRAMGPYGRQAIRNLRVLLPSGPAVEPVQFSAALAEGTLAIPKEFMQAWGLSEADTVAVRPAP